MRLTVVPDLEFTETTHLLQDYLLNDKFKDEEKNGEYSSLFEAFEVAEKLGVDPIRLGYDIEVLRSKRFITSLACNSHPDQVWYTVYFKP